MTTGSHGWLATSFIPEDIVKGVMDNSADNIDVVGGMEYLHPSTDTAETKGEAESVESEPAVTPETTADETEKVTEKETAKETETNPPKETEKPETTAKPTQPVKPVDGDVLGQATLTVGKPDSAGYNVLVNDIEQGIVISEITGSGYKGKVMLIDDPSRVYLGETDRKDEMGMRILTYLDTYDAIAGINASGFMDHAGEGNGGEVVGLSCSEGEYWGTYVNYYGSVVLTGSDKLVVGNISVWNNYDIRDGIQFGPVLIADGTAQVSGSAGYGLQPRTAIGQREDGAIVFLVVDGRDLTWSIGCTVGDMAEILLKYGVVNAACCDGGSSTVMAYNGELLNRNSSANPKYGRMIPNAFLVKRKA